MNLYKYSSYEEYIQQQKRGVYSHPTVANSINYEWIQKSDIDFMHKEIITPYFNSISKDPKKGICHGAKLGKENLWFEQKTGIDFIGTDLIVPTNEEMKLINWDFHIFKEEWDKCFDIIYTNALDHAYDPEKALKNWIRSLNKEGICIIEHTYFHTECTSVDPFGATLDEYINLIKSVNGVIIMQKNFKSNHDKTFLVFKENI